jgi:hypothetical protein
MSVRTWLNNRPGARLIEAEEARTRVAQENLTLAEQVMATRENLANQRPFDPRVDVSVDARYIVKQLVLWFVVLPPLLALLIYVLYRTASS